MSDWAKVCKELPPYRVAIDVSNTGGDPDTYVTGIVTTTMVTVSSSNFKYRAQNTLKYKNRLGIQVSFNIDIFGLQWRLHEEEK